MSETQTVFAIIEASEPDMRLVQVAVTDLARQSTAELWAASLRREV